jgi:hypothetical protein
MSDLRMQRSVLWFIVAMGDSCASFGVARWSAWVAGFGFLMLVGGAWGLRHIYRELKRQKLVLPSLMQDPVFRYELSCHNGQLDRAHEALLRKRGAGLYRSVNQSSTSPAG